MAVLINHQQLLDPVLVEELFRRLHLDTLADRHQLLGHQFLDRLRRIAGEAHIAVRDDAHQRTVAARDHGNTGNRLPVHDRERVGQRLVRVDGDRVDHHAGLEPLHLADLVGLFLGFEILVHDAKAAGLGQRNRHFGFRHGVHRRRKQRNTEPDVLRQLCGGVRIRRQNARFCRFEQNIIECQCIKDFHANPASGESKVDAAYIHKARGGTSIPPVDRKSPVIPYP